MVAHILLVDLKTRRPNGDAVVFQGSEHCLRGHGAVAADPKLPDKEIPAEQQQPEGRKACQQHISSLESPPQHRYAPPPQHGDLCSGLFGHLAQQVLLPQQYPQPQADLRFPCEVPEYDALCPQQIQYPLRTGALDLRPSAALQKMNRSLIHITLSAPPV